MTTKLDELRARKAAREAAEAAEAEAREEHELLLEEQAIADGVGKRGVDFEIVNTEVGCFLLTKPEFVVAKKFNATETKSEEDLIQFVMPSVKYPQRSDASAVFMAHAGVASRCAIALIHMYEARRRDRAGKF